MPATLAERWGEKAWRRCFWLRQACFLFILCIIISALLWLWFPISGLIWPISLNPLTPIVIGVAITIPFSIIMVKAMIDGGKEHAAPYQETTMHQGIYKYIRHPGALGEMPLYIALGFLLNNWFLVLWMTLFVIIYTPLAIYFEEKDLVKRFGDEYLEYKKTTGALFPKIRKKQKPT
jgi:protein-S-isoprenylcysteine O-methyltransferase Ste14